MDLDILKNFFIVLTPIILIVFFTQRLNKFLLKHKNIQKFLLILGGTIFALIIVGMIFFTFVPFAP